MLYKRALAFFFLDFWLPVSSQGGATRESDIEPYVMDTCSRMEIFFFLVSRSRLPFVYEFRSFFLRGEGTDINIFSVGFRTTSHHLICVLIAFFEMRVSMEKRERETLG